uniref:Calcium-responsive transcription factor n=1 Tax=Geotrypetes seraphini TaxID=260995 RepID=A0A6P8QRH4_GEOSA|nr:calcium-responsive transcription factor [Geotrypetes seraphini]XP_033800924.1 calcium-responsive transcription factor [Geotrypetes seraphini]XP_033800925.1 calcium-responsive transcription factor [Geotrypetes seraphini]XP_033800927.1 calcium-responsive transcription factor [Geotrypetes seraphini]
MEENGADHEISMDRSSYLLIANCSGTEETETDAHVFQPLACVGSSDPSFGQNECSTVLPITLHVTDGSSPVQNASVHLSQAQPLPEQFHVIDQSGQAIQYELQSLAGSNTQMMIVTSQSENGQVLHVIPSNSSGMAQVLIPQGQFLDVASSQDLSEEKQNNGNLETVTLATVADNTNSYVLHSQVSVTVPTKTTRVADDLFPIPLQPLSPNTPAWARRIRSCERIGDSYRGYCVSETELESILTLHKQQTQSVWGTRQSPSPAKPATRLMWKSQYVPYDGIPFVNAGSRAIVMECQYGPRRKGTQPKKSSEQEGGCSQIYKATCPARIYIKKVQKFPEYRVPIDPKIDKKIIRMEQEKAFNMLKKNLIEAGGVVRWYVQLPDQQAHQYHDLEPVCLPSSPSQFPLPSLEEEEDATRDENGVPSRLHPQVAEKIRELVSQGTEQVYAVRKQLRKFVEQELFKPDEVPERHNLSYFPTVNDLKNHIHEVQKALGSEDVVYDSETVSEMESEQEPGCKNRELQWTVDNGNVLTETVTVTFASSLTEGSAPGSVIAKVESSQIGESLSPAQLLSSLSSLQPKIFAQLQGLQLQPAFTSTEGTALITINRHSSTNLLDPSGNAVTNQPLVLNQTQNLSPSASLTKNNTVASTQSNLPVAGQNIVSMGQLVTVSSLEGTGDLEGGLHQILLDDGQTIPIRIIDHPTLENQDNTVSMDQMKSGKKAQLIPKDLSSKREQMSDCQDSTV